MLAKIVLVNEPVMVDVSQVVLVKVVHVEPWKQSILVAQKRPHHVNVHLVIVREKKESV